MPANPNEDTKAMKEDKRDASRFIFKTVREI